MKSLGEQEEASRSGHITSLPSFSGNQVSILAISLLDLFFIFYDGLWSKNDNFWDLDVPSKDSIISRITKGCYGIKVQTLCHWNPHASFKELLWPFKPQKAIHGRKGRDFT